MGAANTTTITATAPATNRTYTIPDTGANSSLVMTDLAQTINSAKTFSAITPFTLGLTLAGGQTLNTYLVANHSTTFTATNFTTGTITVQLRRLGDMIYVSVPDISFTTGTSGVSPFASNTVFPATYRPAVNYNGIMFTVVNGVTTATNMIINTAGFLTIYHQLNSNNFSISIPVFIPRTVWVYFAT